jgi:DeoR family glycerol-3-phosphate regulon repressor
MLAEERRRMISEQLAREGAVLVKDLSAKFSVTEDSIRKDLDALQKKGLLRKTYGGAVKPREIAHELLITQRLAINPEGKRAMAQKAIKLISDGDFIFLDNSTANIELAKMVAESGLSVVVATNMIAAMLELAKNGSFKLLFIGGELSRTLDGFVGTAACQELSLYRFDSAFLGAAGVDLEDGSVFTFMPDDGATKRTAIKSAIKPYLMLESRKLSADGNYRYAKLDEFAAAISDGPRPKGMEGNWI